MSAPLIGLVGKKGSGKDTAAAALNEATGGHYTCVACADPLREVVAKAFALDSRHMSGPAKERPGPMGVSYRRGMQQMGMLFREQVNELLPEVCAAPGEFWVEHLGRTLDRHLEAGTPVIVTDVRFANEAEAIVRRGGILLHIDRPPAKLAEFYAANGWNAADAHPSETGVDEICVRFAEHITRVDNSGTVSGLTARMVRACDAVVLRQP